MKHLRKLELRYMGVESWEFATTTIQTIDLTGTSIDNSALQKFRHLEYVTFRFTQSGFTKVFTTLEFANMPYLRQVQVVADLPNAEQDVCARYLHLQGFNTREGGVARRKLT